MKPNIVGTVMLVEDEPVVRLSLADYLEDCGYRVLQTDTPAEALARLNDEAPDLVVCDYMMPGMSGKAFLEQMRREFPSVPVIVFTGMTDEALGRELVASGASACLFKPLPSLRLLLEAVQRAIGVGVDQR